MQNVSTSLTLILKVFLPIAWIVFFGTITISILLTERDFVSGIPIGKLRIGMLLFFISGVSALYWMVMRIKRVDMDDSFAYVTNYHKSFRYPFHNIERMEESDYMFFKTVHIYFKEGGYFGKKVSFVASKDKFKKFLEEHPKVVQELIKSV